MWTLLRKWHGDVTENFTYLTWFIVLIMSCDLWFKTSSRKCPLAVKEFRLWCLDIYGFMWKNMNPMLNCSESKYIFISYDFHSMYISYNRARNGVSFVSSYSGLGVLPILSILLNSPIFQNDQNSGHLYIAFIFDRGHCSSLWRHLTNMNVIWNI